jgi:hypothetical protein
MRKKMKILLVVLSLVTVAFSCTYNVSMAHTEGMASDVIDDTQSPTNDIAPNLTVPLIGK